MSAGVTVAIGTDNTALADDEDLLGEARLSWRLAGDPVWEAAAPPDAATLLRMITVNGARAMGLSGALEASVLVEAMPDALVVRGVYPWPAGE